MIYDIFGFIYILKRNACGLRFQKFSAEHISFFEITIGFEYLFK